MQVKMTLAKLENSSLILFQFILFHIETFTKLDIWDFKF